MSPYIQITNKIENPEWGTTTAATAITVLHLMGYFVGRDLRNCWTTGKITNLFRRPWFALQFRVFQASWASFEEKLSLPKGIGRKMDFFTKISKKKLGNISSKTSLATLFTWFKSLLYPRLCPIFSPSNSSWARMLNFIICGRFLVSHNQTEFNSKASK